MFRLITNWFPKKFRSNFNSLVIYSRLNFNKEKFLGFFAVMSLTIAILLSFIIAFLFDVGFFLVFLITFFVIEIGSYFALSLKADSVGKAVEDILPDALQLMTSNLRAGLTTDKALLLAARPEFGALSFELDRIGRILALGGNISEALLDMSKRIKSEKFRKSILLIVSGLESGGEITDLLDQVANNLRQERFVDEKIRTNVLMYVIFIFVAIGVGAPMLFGLSSFLISVLQENLANIEIPENTNVPITFSKITLSSSYIVTFSVISLVTSAILGSLVLGLIKNGKEKKGVKLIPVLVILSLFVFFLARFLIKTLLGGSFGI